MSYPDVLYSFSGLDMLMVRPLGLGRMPRVHLRLLNHYLPVKPVMTMVTSGTLYVEIVLYILIQVIFFLSRRVRLDRLRHTFVLAQCHMDPSSVKGLKDLEP